MESPIHKEVARRADLSRIPVFMAEGLMATYNRNYRDHLRANGATVAIHV